MNRKQRIVLWIGVLFVVVMGLFPPIQVDTFRPSWQNDFDETVPAVATAYRYQFVGSNNRIFMDETGAAVGSKIGWARLRLQWLGVVLVMLVMFFIWRDERNGDGGWDHPEPVRPVEPHSPQQMPISA